MYAWIIAHNLGIFLIIAPLALISWVLMKIEDKIIEILREKA